MSNRTLAEGALVGLCVTLVCVIAVLLFVRDTAPPTIPPLTAVVAQDVMRNAAVSREETLAKFKVLSINGPYVRAIVQVPEEFTGDMPVDIVYAYEGWRLVRIEPVRGKVPGPG